MPLCRPIANRKWLWEVSEADLSGNRIAHVFSCANKGEFVRLHGFIKTTQKVRLAELYLAIRRKRGFVMTDGAEKGRAGRVVEGLLEEQGAYGETMEQAVKRVLTFQLTEVVKAQRINKVEMAERLPTSHVQLDRLLDPDNDGVSLRMLAQDTPTSESYSGSFPVQPSCQVAPWYGPESRQQ